MSTFYVLDIRLSKFYMHQKKKKKKFYMHHLSPYNNCFSQGRLGYAVVTNNPQIFVASNDKAYFSPLLHVHCRLVGALIHVTLTLQPQQPSSQYLDHSLCGRAQESPRGSHISN